MEGGQMSRRGYIYVLSNPSMPGLLKVGRCIDGGRARAKQLYQTGVPTPFVVEFELLSDEPDAVEAEAHERLRDFRVNGGREFFSTDIYEAKRAVIEAEVTLCSLALVSIEELDGLGDLYIIAETHGAHPIEAVSALRFLTDEEFGVVYLRYLEWRGKRMKELAEGRP